MPFSVADGILANAALSGANTVMFFAEFSVSTRPAALTAATSVDSTGLAEAAVATGAVAMPLKLPAPDFGTEEQAGPKSVVVVAEPEPAAAGAEEPAAAGADEPEPEAVEEEVELQAAAPRPSVSARPDTARNWYFTVFSLRDVCSLDEVRLVPHPGCGPSRDGHHD